MISTPAISSGIDSSWPIVVPKCGTGISWPAASPSTASITSPRMGRWAIHSTILHKRKMTFTAVDGDGTNRPADIGLLIGHAAGGNPTISVFDELWAYTSERSHRLGPRAELRVCIRYMGQSLQQGSPYVFVTEAGTPVTPVWFLRMTQRTGRAAKLPFQVHPHMLRHSTGYKLANDGQDTRSLAHYLGHRNLQSTARYTALAPDRFRSFWKD